MLASSANVFLPFNTFSRHRICSARRLRFPLPFTRFFSPFSGHPNNPGTLVYAASASPDGHLIETPITNAVEVDATIFQTLSARQKEKISVFVSALLEWNERMNLTSERKESEVMKRHVEDSLALLTPLRRSYLSMCCSSSSPSCDGLKLVDVGSGSGLPGLILAIACPTWNVTLLESMQKRCFFLEHVVRLNGLSNVEVLRERAENAGQCLDFRELFDVAVARAVAEMRILAEYCLPLVRVGGLFIAAKGHNPQEEIRNSEKAIQLMGGSMVELCTVESHSPLGQRTAVICFKEHATPKKYPRNTGCVRDSSSSKINIELTPAVHAITPSSRTPTLLSLSPLLAEPSPSRRQVVAACRARRIVDSWPTFVVHSFVTGHYYKMK